MIFGVAVLALCTLVGKILGSLLGLAMGTDAEIGGVGFAMLLLLFLNNSRCLAKMRTESFAMGIDFWKKMFIPAVIAMAATQNVYSALSGGLVAVLAGLLAVVMAFLVLWLAGRFLKEERKEGDQNHD